MRRAVLEIERSALAPCCGNRIPDGKQKSSLTEWPSIRSRAATTSNFGAPKR
jgi:hypothetical protein